MSARKIFLRITFVVNAAAILSTGCGSTSVSSSDVSTAGETAAAAAMTTIAAEPTTEQSAADNSVIEVCDVDGSGSCYEFTYCGETFRAEYTPDNWKIKDSYRITDTSDMTAVCAALSEIHPIHGKDMSSYRTPEDMAYEWEQHNLAYQLLPDDSPYKENAKDVDLNPEDQGKSIIDFALGHIG